MIRWDSGFRYRVSPKKKPQTFSPRRLTGYDGTDFIENLYKIKFMKIALTTGSSKGIGRAIAIRLAKDGYYSFVTYNTDEKGADQKLLMSLI